MPRAPPSRQSEEPGKPKKIPRPPNAWIIYRTDRLNEWKESRSPYDPPVKQADISRMIALRWKHESGPMKLEYEKRAAIAKAEHKKKYPNYKYNPMSKQAKAKMRAEEREEKKRVREEAKAAKAAERKVSNGSRGRSSPRTPSGSNVKLETYEQVPKPLRVRDPIRRGCGPSPPLDYDPPTPSSVSSTPLLSSSSSGSIRSSPLPPSSSSASLDPAHASWMQALASPASSPLAQPPPPAYPSGFVESPAPSRQSSYNFSRAFPPSSDASSTPSDSPPSYSEGEGWQPQPPDSAYQTFTPIPDAQNDWNAYGQYQPLLQPDVSIPAPVIDPLLTMPDPDVVNYTSTSAEAVFDLASVEINSAQSPPGELDPVALQHLLHALGFPPSNDMDQLGPMLDMPELQESMEDRADGAGVAALSDEQPCTFEDFAAYINAHPGDGMNMADPAFYHHLGLQFMAACSQTTPDMPLPADFNAMPVMQELGPEQNISAYQTFPYGVQQQVVQPQLAMPVPVAPVSMHALASVTPSIQTNVLPPTPPSVHTPDHSVPLSHHAEAAVAQTGRRYVPPSGAGMPARRRVAGRFMPRRSDHSD